MKVPLSSTTTTLTASSLSYEPKSVLDLQRSPSPPAPVVPSLPVAGNTPSADLDSLDGWDSFLSDLGLHEDSPPPPRFLSQLLPDFPSSQPFDPPPPPFLPPSDLSLSDFPTNFPPLDPNPTVAIGFGLDFVDDLIRAAQAFESNDTHTAHVVLARLNQRLRSPSEKPLQRAAFYFKEALHHLISIGPNRPPVRLSSYDVVQTIRAHKAFSGISPISLFSTFTANQAILDVLDGSRLIHVIDFDIGFGGHWASLMRELADKSTGPIVLRITAVVPEEFGVEGKLVRENLTQFARDLNINFHLDYILTRNFEFLSFKAIKFIEGEKLAVHLSPSIFQRLSVTKFVGGLRSLCAHVIVVVDKEVGIDTGTASFSLNFMGLLQFYTAMMESLDAASSGGGGGGEWVRRIETFLLRPRIMAAVETAGRKETPPWREAAVAAGGRAVGLSQFADFQAECLLRRAQVGGFHVVKRHGEMMLCWHDKPLVSTSAWRF